MFEILGFIFLVGLTIVFFTLWVILIWAIIKFIKDDK